MANLNVRKLDDNVYEQWRVRAAKHGVSMEGEVRQIIGQVVKAPDKLSAVFRNYFGHDNGVDKGVDLDIPDRNNSHNPMDFHG